MKIKTWDLMNEKERGKYAFEHSHEIPIIEGDKIK